MSGVSIEEVNDRFVRSIRTADVNPRTIATRIYKGWDPVRVVTTPVFQ